MLFTEDPPSEGSPPGIEPLEARLTKAERVAELLDTLLDVLSRKEREESERLVDPESGRYPYIPLSRVTFTQILLNIERLFGDEFVRTARCSHCGSAVSEKVTFVDVGCGVADKVLLASHIGFDAHGVEIDPYLISRAEEHPGARVTKSDRYLPPLPTPAWADPLITIYAADALTFRYSEFAVIYFYRPFSDKALQTRLERRIWRQARPGAFVVACNSVTKPPADFVAVTDWNGYVLPRYCAVYRRAGEGETGKAKKRIRRAATS